MGVNSWKTIFTKILKRCYPHLKQGNSHIVFTPVLYFSLLSTLMSGTCLYKYNDYLIVGPVNYYLITLSMFTGAVIFG